MNDDLKNESFDELLGAALDEYVRDDPRPGFERRIVANLPARRLAQGWAVWAAFATASVCAIALLSLHHHRPSAQPAGVSALLWDRGTPIAQARVFGRPEGKSVRHPMASSSAEATAYSASSDSRSTGGEFASETGDSATAKESPAAATANKAAKIEPIPIDPLVVPPLSSEEAATQPILPIKVEPIQIPPIQISKLEVDHSDSNQ